MKKFSISAGHGKHVSGANGKIKEHESAIKVTNRVYEILTREYNGKGSKFIETTATTQQKNLENIVKFHNTQKRDLDIAVHFNSASPSATGSEVCYYDLKGLSTKLSKAMANALGIADRGAKERKELYVLRNTTEKAILLEVCFVTSEKDTKSFKKNFEKLCQAIAKEIATYLGYKKHTKVSKSQDVYVVKKGDTLSSIARDNKMALGTLLKKNPRVDIKDVILVGQKIKI